MDLKVIAVLFGALVSRFILDGVEASIIGREEKHKHPAIPAAKGEMYDCVDIHKQKSFQHPDLIDHQDKTSPGEKYVDSLTDSSYKLEDIDENITSAVGWPSGTVAIRRQTRRQLQEAKYNGGVEFAGITLQDGGKGYIGAKAYVAVHKPKVDPSSHQFSAASIIIEKGENQIQAGWIVHPDLYHDTNTRFYTYWTKDNHRTTGCYNTDCPGFVIVSDEYPLNFSFEQISDPNRGVEYDVKISIDQEDVSGNWYVSVDDSPIGYWPQRLFEDFGTADTIHWGGQVYSPPPSDKSPPMGSGKFFGGNPYITAYMKMVQVVFSDNTYGPPPRNLVQEFDSRCYYAGWEAYSSDEGYNFLYGGTGGKDGVTCM